MTESTKDTTPLPGTQRAYNLGCVCPRKVNSFGAGTDGRGMRFELDMRCTLHGNETNWAREYIRSLSVPVRDEKKMKKRTLLEPDQRKKLIEVLRVNTAGLKKNDKVDGPKRKKIYQQIADTFNIHWTTCYAYDPNTKYSAGRKRGSLRRRIRKHKKNGAKTKRARRRQSNGKRQYTTRDPGKLVRSLLAKADDWRAKANELESAARTIEKAELDA